MSVPEADRAVARPAATGTVLAVLCLAQLMLGIDVTIVQIANPTIQKELGFSTLDLQWTVTAYALTFGGFLLLGGRLSDLFGSRRLFVAGMTGFALSSVGAGAANGLGMLVAFRAAQGLCAAMVSPSVLALLTDSFPAGRQRERAYGLWASAIATGGITGYVVGGALIAAIGWRGIFYINVPVCAAAVILALRCIPTHRRSGARPRLDLAGAVTVTSGLALFIFGLGQAQSHGWGSASPTSCFCLAAMLLSAFVLIETRVSHPLLPIRLLRRRPAVANLLVAMQASSVGASVFLNSLYLQQVFKYSPQETGLAVVPLSVAIIAASNCSSLMIGRLGPRRLAPVGFLLIAGALFWLSVVPDHGAYEATYLPALVAEGFGMGLAVVALVSTATSGVGQSDRGVVGGMYNMSQQLGSAIGIGVLVTVVAAGTAHVQAYESGAAAEATGIRLGYHVAAFVAIAAAGVAALALPSSIERSDAVAGSDAEVSIATERLPVPDVSGP